MTTGPTVSVIIPAWNEAATIGTQLAALARQEGVIPMEIIVADNGSTDRTLEVVRSYQEALPQLRSITADKVIGPSHARNEGARLANGDVLAFCDSDDEVDERWLQELVAGLADADFAGGVLSTARLNSATVREWRAMRDSGPESDAFLPVAVTSNMAIWRKVFIEVGMFDESFVWGHDNEFSYRLQLGGYRYRFVPTAVVHYRLRSSLGAVMRREYRDKSSAAHLYAAFSSEGFPRRSAVGVLKQWAWLVLHIPDLRRKATRGRWLRKVAGAAGRIRGSIRHRVLYL